MESLVQENRLSESIYEKQFAYRETEEKTVADIRNWKWHPATPNLLPGQGEVAWSVVLDVDAAHIGTGAAAGAGDGPPRAAPPPRVAPPPRAAPPHAASAAVAAVVFVGAGVAGVPLVLPGGEQRPLRGCT